MAFETVKGCVLDSVVKLTRIVIFELLSLRRIVIDGAKERGAPSKDSSYPFHSFQCLTETDLIPRGRSASIDRYKKESIDALRFSGPRSVSSARRPSLERVENFRRKKF